MSPVSPPSPSCNWPSYNCGGHRRSKDLPLLANHLSRLPPELRDSIGDIEIWKSNINDELTSIKQEILRLSGRLDNLQKAVLGKVNEYNQNISDVGVEIKALERVMQNILQPLTSNIRELSKVTEDIKRGKNL